MRKAAGIRCFLALLSLALAAGCATERAMVGPGMQSAGPALATADDDRLSAGLARVIVPGGPGAWAEAAAWDEYLLEVRNTGSGSLRIVGVTLADYLDARLQPSRGMVRLTQTSDRTRDRFLSEGIEIATGPGAASLPPVPFDEPLIPRSEERRIAQAIRDRSTRLPIVLAPGETASINLFFALAPSPRRIEIEYDADGDAITLAINTSEALRGLHLNVIQR